MYFRERTSYLAKGCRILGKEQTIQRKVDVFWRKNKLSSEKSSYFRERTNYSAKGRRILGKERTIQRKVVVSWRKDNLSSEWLMYLDITTMY